jgi:hypothetical protein
MLHGSAPAHFESNIGELKRQANYPSPASGRYP